MRIADKEKQVTKKVKKQNYALYKFISFILIITTIVSISYILYQNIVPLMYAIIGTIGVLFVTYLFVIILNKTKLKAWVKNIFSFISIAMIVLELCALFFSAKTFDFLESIMDNGHRVNEYAVYVLKSSNITKLEELNDKKIEYISSDSDTKINDVLTQLKESINFDEDEVNCLDDLVNEINGNKTDGILLDRSYEDILKEEYEETYNNLKMLKTYKINSKVDVLKSDKDITKDTFIMYVSGIDTSGNVASKARSDVNLLIGVNPKTQKILLVNTPRDYYVKLNKNGKYDKLTHAGIYGVEESLKTLEDLYNADIDYYARVNFTSFVKLVDALGGVTVNVPKDFCEQNSKRSFEDKDLICLKKGNQNLKGEQALAYARNRHAFQEGDRARGEHQMELVKAIINKAISPNIITKYTSLLNALDGKISTNMSNDEIIKFIKNQMKKELNWSFETINADGSDSYGVCYSTGSAKAYVMKPNEETVNNIKQAFNNLIENKDVLVG